MLTEVVKSLVNYPIWHILYLLFAPHENFKGPIKFKEFTFEFKPTFLITYNLSISVYALISWLSFKYTFPDLTQEINWKYWIPVIILRDVFFTVITYEPWHILTYEYKKTVKKLEKTKFNPEMPEQSQWTHDRFWSLSGTVIAALHELFAIYLWSNGYAKYYISFWSFPLYSILWALFAIWWRHFHFFFVHRMIHPWFHRKSKWKSVDVGRFLYKHVHSLHHKSYNPGPWSGLSMHPVEHLFYYSCVWVPALFISQHPIHFMINKFHATISPAPGHDGYDKPVGGDYFHYLHHAHYECNYGTEMVQLDKLFGTFADGTTFAKKEK